MLSLSLSSSLLYYYKHPHDRVSSKATAIPPQECNALSVLLCRLEVPSRDLRGDGLLPGLRGKTHCKLLLVGQQIRTSLHIFLVVCVCVGGEVYKGTEI